MNQGAEEASKRSFVIPGAWIVEAQLGRGGMGEVYRVRHPKTQTRAALKVLLGDYSKRPDVVARFRQEAIAVNIINSPGIVRVFDSGELADGRPYILMEYLHGKVLREWIEDIPREARGREVVRICYQVASVMSEAHDRKVVHRDLKPENIMIVDDSLAPGGSRAKILDFGIAKVIWTNVADVIEVDESMKPPSARQPSIEAERFGLSSAAAATTLRGTAEGSGEPLRTLPSVAEGLPTSLQDPIVSPVASTNGSPPTLQGSPESHPSTHPGTSQAAIAASFLPDESMVGSRRVDRPPIPPTMPYTKDGIRGMGTKDYMPPEQEEHSASVDHRADVYSLGVILYELLEGSNPDKQSQPWPPPMRAKVSAELSSLVGEMLAKDPQQRPAMARVAATLRRIGRAKPEFEAALLSWINGKKKSEFLPRGKMLHELAAWARDVDDLTSEERNFLESATAAESAHERMVRMSLVAGVVVLAALFFATTYLWIDAKEARGKAQDAQEEAQRAQETARRHALSEEAAKRAAIKHAEAEKRAREEMEKSLLAVEEAVEKFGLASVDANKARAARSAMAKAKQTAEQAAAEAKKAAHAAEIAKNLAVQERDKTKSELELEISRLKDSERDLRAKLERALHDLKQAKDELQVAKDALAANGVELETAKRAVADGEKKIAGQVEQIEQLGQRLREAGEKISELERLIAEGQHPSSPPPSPLNQRP